MEVMSLARLQRTVEAVIGVHPGGIRRCPPTVTPNNTNPCRHAPVMLVADVEGQPGLRVLVTALGRDDGNLSAAGDVPDAQAGIALLITDVGDAPAVGRPARVP